MCPQTGEKMRKKQRNNVGKSEHNQIIDSIHKMFLENGSEMVQVARQMFSEHGRGYLNVYMKGSKAFKAGEVHYITVEENKQIEAVMEKFTANDVLLASHLANYNPKNEAVVMVWYGTFYYVNKITDTLLPLFCNLNEEVIH